MSNLSIEREFAITANQLFDWVSKSDNLVKWWGPEGMHIPRHDLDFTRTGPWYSVMSNGEDVEVKVSGHVTHVDPPNSIGFTWAWHDEDDQRGSDSHVTLTVLPTTAGARLVIDHRDLKDSEQAASHKRGWTSTLQKLSALLN